LYERGSDSHYSKFVDEPLSLRRPRNYSSAVSMGGSCAGSGSFNENSQGDLVDDFASGADSDIRATSQHV